MAYKYCQHVRENGTYCSSGAVKGRAYCYFHLRSRARRLAVAQAQSQQKPWRLELPPLEDMHAVQVALMQVVEGLGTGALDEHRAGLMLYGLQQAASNIRAYRAWIQPSRFALDPDDGERTVDNYPGLEAEFGLPKRIDLDAPPETLFPPPDPEPAPAPIALDHGPESPAARKPPKGAKPQKPALEALTLDRRSTAAAADHD